MTRAAVLRPARCLSSPAVVALCLSLLQRLLARLPSEPPAGAAASAKAARCVAFTCVLVQGALGAFKCYHAACWEALAGMGDAQDLQAWEADDLFGSTLTDVALDEGSVAVRKGGAA